MTQPTIMRARGRAPLFAMLVLAGCGGGGASNTDVAVVTGAAAGGPAPVATSTPTPTPTPDQTSTTPAGTSVTASLAGLPSVDDGLDFASLTGSMRVPGKSNDVVGAFRFICSAGQLLWDDPIVYPGRPGASPHLHQFFGNLNANGNSTYQSLRTSGDSTCMNALNRSAYWTPAMMNGRGQVVRPDNVSVYYKQRPASDPECLKIAARGCIPLPRGLRIIFGYNMSTGAISNEHWNYDNGPASTTIADAAKGRSANGVLTGTLDTPMCWDGVNLDSADHRSHMAYPSYGNWGYQKCPDGYPYAVPQFIMAVNYTTDDTFARDGSESWYLSSDRMEGMPATAAGLSLHADWFGAWNDRAQAMWQSNCIDKLLDGVDGDLCGGLILNRGAYYPYGVANPRLVAIPPRS